MVPCTVNFGAEYLCGYPTVDQFFSTEESGSSHAVSSPAVEGPPKPRAFRSQGKLLEATGFQYFITPTLGLRKAMAVAFAYAQRMLDEGRVPDWLVRIGIRMKLAADSAVDSVPVGRCFRPLVYPPFFQTCLFV